MPRTSKRLTGGAQPTYDIFREVSRLHEENQQLRAQLRYYSRILELLSHDVYRSAYTLPERARLP